MLRFFAVILLYIFSFPSTNDTDTSTLRMENDVSFKAQKSDLAAHNIQMFVGLLNKDLKSIDQKQPAGFNFEKDALPIDIFNYWNDKGDESYYVLLTKVIYVIDKDISFFDENLLSNEQMLKDKMPDYRLEKTGVNQFHMDCGFMAPSFDYKLSFHQPPFKEDKIAKMQKALQRLNPELGEPEFTVLQHNYDYGRVMMHKTSKMSVCVVNYYPFGEGQTLEVNYTLNYIHELPPGLLGGHKLLIKEIKEGIVSLIYNTRSVFTTL